MRMLCSFAVLLIASGCGGGGGGTGSSPTGPTGPSSPSASASVSMRSEGDGYGGTGHAFAPTSVTIARAGTVTWNNTSGQVHNVTFSALAGAPANIGDHASGTTPRQFNTAGAFNYSCTNHPGMAGQVTVQ